MAEAKMTDAKTTGPKIGPVWTAYEAAAATGGMLGAVGEAVSWDAEHLPEEEWQAFGLSIDTRTLRPGEIFVAVSDVRDGHDFVGQAFKAGAAAALVSRAPQNAPSDAPLLVVPDAMGGTMAGLNALAAAARDRCFGQLIGVTGSAGKTSVKEMLRAALAPSGKVHAADKSFNNHLGVPLTLAGLPQDADFGVFEIGMNHAGEITPLTRLVNPHVVVITTVAEAHIEFFDSLDGIAEAKAEILLGVREGGTAILPADNQYFGFLTERARSLGIGTIIPFGETATGERAARLLSYAPMPGGSRVEASIGGQRVAFTLSAPGKHQAVNALAAIAAAMAAGASLERTIAGIEDFSAGGGRGARHEVRLGGKSVTLIDESYNANPASVRAGLRVLGEEAIRKGARRVAVLGDMKELGTNSESLHAELAADVVAASIDRVHTAGGDMAHLRNALPEELRGRHEGAAIDLKDALLAEIGEGDVILFKGSNASRVGALVSALLETAEGAKS